MDQKLQLERDAEVETLRRMVEDLKTQLEEGKPTLDADLIEREMDVLYDPFDAQNPFRINGFIPPDAEYPEGQALRWLSPQYRDRRGKRGWEYIGWEDKYAEDALKCIPEKPERMEGQAGFDGLIRRADMVLGRLDMRIFQSRLKKPVLESMRRKGAFDEDTVKTLRSGVTITGPGFKRDEDPKRVEKTGSKFSTFDPGSGTGSSVQELTQSKDNNG